MAFNFKIKNAYCKRVWDDISARYADQDHFLQAAGLVLETISPVVDTMPELENTAVLERFVEPERIVMFRVPWTDDKGVNHINRGFRVQFNSAIGPYKGGLRFSPEVNLDVLKFLGFEQVLKNSLTTLPMGGGKGGSDFDPHGKSDNEVMRFCQSFMTELCRHIGPDTDVPAGDKGVGGREVAYMFGQYKRIRDEFTGVLTGKGLSFGGSLIRTEATGYGLCYFTEEALKVMNNDSFKGKTVVVSGSGNVAIYACQKAQMLGGKVVAMSDSNGYVYDANGIDVAVVKQIKEVERGRISEYAKRCKTAKYVEGSKNIWEIKCDIALPCATQNEIDIDSAKTLVKNGVIAVCEGANMPSSLEAAKYFMSNNVIFGPAKASNAGGVATSGLEMCQNSMRYSWSAAEVDGKLKDIMTGIFHNIYNTATDYGNKYNLLQGANIYGFNKVCTAMLAQGIF